MHGLEVVPVGPRFPRSSARMFVPNPYSELAREMVGRINKYRAARRLPDLATSAILCGTAQDWATRMASIQHLFHGDHVARLAAVGIRNIAAGECIAEGESIDQVINLWVNDPPHRAILLGSFGRAGVGMAKDNNGWGYWCLDVASGQD